MLFTNKSFHVFHASSLEERTQEIRKEIQPIFQQIGEKVCPFFTEKLDTPFYLHIAQHRRRSVYPPEETWAAFGPNKRGYKMDAHFQIGITREYAFVWLSVIDQPKNQQQIARCWSEKPALFETLPQDFVLSLDHTQYGYQPIREWPAALERLTTVKKSELQIGKVYLKDQISTLTMEQLLADYRLLLPLYRNRGELPILNQEGN
ncbi:DUF1054 family protein [Enterococcus gallinarum]|uniref:DUF1054 family protein n=1 Tax=Enterococcus gallinarum TaxID=1353 RepID=A0ABD4HPK3_ENTGA|nr:DUF1054 family protein [Enterococcus gallinarum]MBA0949120.1 DUF1054 family protein [Enterococcus gallinarum]MBA0962124.1 DUF1054 family protein [Enterococcus gallinarum]MBA0970068.1 DUF1054 family protein [Enterococcus gallinarum]MBA0973439.1 DUF1054 family protein [Enterococcus gallinarum]MCR1930489.1 DUF1054 domain-containing protein [Enterococcus gallinarum]